MDTEDNLPDIDVSKNTYDFRRMRVNRMDTDDDVIENDRPDIDGKQTSFEYRRMRVNEMDTDDVTDEIEIEDTADKIVIGMGDTLEINSRGINRSDRATEIYPADDDEESRGDATFTFSIEIHDIRDTVLSPPCIIRNLPWKIMLIQKATDRQSRHLGFFIQCNGDSDIANWSCYAIADLALVTHNPDMENFSRRISHLFYNKENDWGFSNFMPWNEIIDPEKGYVKDGCLTFQARVIADAPHGVCWDSKKYTGYVGLKNQGATCYMNSLLQTLYFTTQLRTVVYKMPTESDDSTKSVALALQRVFYDLQTCDKPVGTKKLTKSFGWETLDSFMQHDVQEFLRVLLDKLESKMKGTSIEGTIPKLFEGKMESFIKCKNVDYESKRTETFYDIQLNIKGKNHIYDSFKEYVATEVLDGDNKYDAGEHGLQDAEKGVIFESFPPVLHLHLMRFQYDPITDCCIKYNDKFEFYEKLDLSPYLRSPESMPAHYTLHAVLVHSGDNHGGHYVVFIDPKGDGKWCKFDDDVVSRCSKLEAIDYNYGGVEEEVSMTSRHCTNAYMLVYIRDSELPTIVQDVTPADLSSELDARLQEEKRMEIIRRRERNECNDYMTVNVLFEDSFEGHQGTDLFDMEQVTYRTFRVKKTTQVEYILELVADTLNYPMDQMKIWPFSFRPNGAYRPLYFDIETECGKPILDLNDDTGPWNLFVEVARLDTDDVLPSYDSTTDILAFFKVYDPKLKIIYYCGHLYVSSGTSLASLMPIINERAGFPQGTQLMVFEERKPYEVYPIYQVDDAIEKAVEDAADGEVYIFQKKDSNLCDLPNCVEFYRDLNYHRPILFVDKNVLNDTGFIVEISLRMPLEEVLEVVAERVGIDKHRIQLYKCQPSMKDNIGDPVRYPYQGCLEDLTYTMTNKKTIRKLYYQQLLIPLPELESKKPIKVYWVGYNLKEEKEYTLYPNKNDTVAELLEEAASIAEFDPEGSGKLRMLELQSCRIVSMVGKSTPIELLATTKIYRIEEIPKDEEHLASDEFLVPIAHFQKDSCTTFGIPFLLKARNKELYSVVRERIATRLQIPVKEFEKYKFAIIVFGKVRFLDDEIYLPGDISTYDINCTGGIAAVSKPWFGLEHANKASKRSRYHYTEKSIKIYN